VEVLITTRVKTVNSFGLAVSTAACRNDQMIYEQEIGTNTYVIYDAVRVRVERYGDTSDETFSISEVRSEGMDGCSLRKTND
jgi:hypothetical protein